MESGVDSIKRYAARARVLRVICFDAMPALLMHRPRATCLLICRARRDARYGECHHRNTLDIVMHGAMRYADYDTLPHAIRAITPPHDYAATLIAAAIFRYATYAADVAATIDFDDAADAFRCHDDMFRHTPAFSRCCRAPPYYIVATPMICCHVLR